MWLSKIKIITHLDAFCSAASHMHSTFSDITGCARLSMWLFRYFNWIACHTHDNLSFRRNFVGAVKCCWGTHKNIKPIFGQKGVVQYEWQLPWFYLSRLLILYPAQSRKAISNITSVMATKDHICYFMRFI